MKWTRWCIEKNRSSRGGWAAILGEVGLDVAYQVLLERQLTTLRSVLSYVDKNPRISLHSFQPTSLMLAELRLNPVATPILHWWTGTAPETRQAVEISCYFSVHSAVARHWRAFSLRTALPHPGATRAPAGESDHGWADPPGAISHRVIWVEYLLSASLGVHVREVRQLVWQNFSQVVRLTGTRQLLPERLVEILG